MNYRGIIHAHSTYSYDGKCSLAELRTLLLAHDVQFVCMSEHTDELTPDAAERFVAECRELSDEQFVFVPGFEVPYQRAHILQFGSTTFLTRFANADTLRRWSAEAALTVLAHPVRNHFLLDAVMREVIDGVEIWNQQYDGKQVPRPRAAQLLEDVRCDNPKLLATGGVDFHREEHLGNPYVSMELSELSEAAVLGALKNGAFSFGTDGQLLSAEEVWKPTLGQSAQSAIATTTIAAGKWVNKTLAASGLSLPRWLRRMIRQRL